MDRLGTSTLQGASGRVPKAREKFLKKKKNKKKKKIK
jgi:hypothetical protein